MPLLCLIHLFQTWLAYWVLSRLQHNYAFHKFVYTFLPSCPFSQLSQTLECYPLKFFLPWSTSKTISPTKLSPFSQPENILLPQPEFPLHLGFLYSPFYLILVVCILLLNNVQMSYLICLFFFYRRSFYIVIALKILSKWINDYKIPLALGKLII